MPSNSSLQPIHPYLSSSTASASPDQMVFSPEPLIPSSVSSPTTISSDSDNFIFVQPDHPMITRAKSSIFKPCLYTASTISTTIPKSLQQAIQTPHWF